MNRLARMALVILVLASVMYLQRWARERDKRTDGAIPASGTTIVSGIAKFDINHWTPPSDSEIPTDSLGASIRRGLALLTHTTDSLPHFAPGHINCVNCHRDGGRNLDAAPLAGAQARFPKYMERTGAVITLADRINYCFTRSLGGNKLPHDSREMADIIAYVAFISRDVPVGALTHGYDGLHKMTDPLTGDVTRGANLFTTTCAACHGFDGQGSAVVPAVWGPKSYAIGASMAREERAASFIWYNMPLGKSRSLTTQQAFDVASYINSMPRPDSPGKERDFPAGNAPKDVPYRTAGHEPYRAPKSLIARSSREGIVPAPTSVKGRGLQ
ncbi:MAG: cytochrome c class [Gemmatimonadetes bacterium]|nr:cytochrome c class [Gemmatimonadota bacterium]